MELSHALDIYIYDHPASKGEVGAFHVVNLVNYSI